MALPPVRRRYRSALPLFNPTSTVDLEAGRHDRIKVIVRGRLLHQGPYSMVNYIQAQDVSQSLFFRRPETRYGKVTLRSRTNVVGGVGWLLSAKVTLRETDVATSHFCPVEIELDLNPTRFRAHRRESFDEIEAMSAMAALTQDAAVRREITSQTLNRADNYIPDDARLRETCGDGWERLLEVYWAHVQQLLAEELDPDAMGMREHLPGIYLRLDWHQATVRQSEVYWEYSHPSARLFVRQLETALEDIADQASHTRFSVGRESEARQVQWQLRSNVQAAIYAKAQGRVRFEVRYAAPPSRSTYPRPWAVIGLVPRLMHIRRDAQRRLEVVVRTLQSRIAQSEATGITRMVEIVADILEATGGNCQMAARVLEALIVSGGIIEGSPGVPLEVISALRRRGLVARYRLRLRGQPSSHPLALPTADADLLRRMLGALSSHHGEAAAA
jgi:hypothetical protein